MIADDRLLPFGGLGILDRTIERSIQSMTKIHTDAEGDASGYRTQNNVLAKQLPPLEYMPEYTVAMV